MKNMRHKKLITRLLILIITLLLIVFVLESYSVRLSHRRHSNIREVRTKNILYDLCQGVFLVMAETETMPPDSPEAPTKLSDLFVWFSDGGLLPSEGYIDIKNKSIHDDWGNPIVLITKEGKLSALGSAVGYGFGRVQMTGTMRISGTDVLWVRQRQDLMKRVLDTMIQILGNQ